MGGTRCIVYGCNNSCRKKDKNHNIIMPHVLELKFHHPRESEVEKWQRKIGSYREDDLLNVSTGSVVCSNHFREGKPTEAHRTPCLYLKGYPSWAISCTKVIEMLKNTPPGKAHEILAHVVPSMHPVVACELARSASNAGLVPASYNATIVTQKNVISLITEMLKDMNDLTRVSLLKFATDVLAPGIMHGALAKFILNPAGELYQSVATKSLTKPPQAPTKPPQASSSASSSAAEITSPDLSTSISPEPLVQNVPDSPPLNPRPSSEFPKIPQDSPTDISEHSYSSIKMSDSRKRKLSHVRPATSLSSCCKKKACRENVQIIKAQKRAIEDLARKNAVLEYNMYLMNEKLMTEKEKTKMLRLQNNMLKAAEKLNGLSIEHIKSSPKLMNVYTGLPFSVFDYLFGILKEPASNMQYWKGPASSEQKAYSKGDHERPGKKRSLSMENELLLVLMKIRMNLSEEYLASVFKISQPTVSSILVTWINLISLETEPLIPWPTLEQTQRNHPECFKKWGGMVRCIIDCTEIFLEKSSSAAANAATFSSYKHHQTIKFLIACTPQGVISFVSEAAGGRISDQALVERSGFCNLLQAGDIVMADKGFPIQGLLLDSGARLVIPPFTKKGKQFTKKKAALTKVVANARIHVERVIGRMKNWKIVSGIMPITMVDMAGQIMRIIGALINLLPPLVPLGKEDMFV